MDDKALTVTLTPAELKWLRSGERGLSSEAIFERMTGIPVGHGWGHSEHPWDPDDLRRCELLLEAVPQYRGRFAEMAGVSPKWAALVAVWPTLAETLRNETVASSRAPKTYDMMKRALATPKVPE